MPMSTLLKAISGVTVLVLGFIRKEILEPTLKLKEKIGDVDSELYSLQKLVNKNLLPEDNCNISEDDIKYYENLSRKICKSTHSMPGYFVIRHLFRLPPYGDLRESREELSALSEGLKSIKETERKLPVHKRNGNHPCGRDQDIAEIKRTILKIQKLLRIPQASPSKNAQANR